MFVLTMLNIKLKLWADKYILNSSFGEVMVFENFWGTINCCLLYYYTVAIITVQ